jgi:hypothetical protein
VCTGSLHHSRGLYKLDCSLIDPSPTIASASLDLYHRRLGHAHPQAVADLYQHQLVDGMDLDPSSEATPCDACLRSKQVKAAVPKMREGEKSSGRLDLVFIDLCRAFDTTSQSRNNYMLDIVDDCTSRGWCIPVANKSHALKALIAW